MNHLYLKPLRLIVLWLLIIAAAIFARGEKADTIHYNINFHTGDEIRQHKIEDEQKIIFLPVGESAAGADSIARLVSSFYMDQYRHFQDPLAPYFLLMSKDAKLAMGVGGAVRMRVWEDIDGEIPANGFSPYLIPTTSNPMKRGGLGGTPGSTTIYMRIIGRNPIFGNIIGNIQGNFNGQRYGFLLKKAYMQMMGFTIGLAPSTVSDPAAEAPTVDASGQNGLVGHSRMLIRWDKGFAAKRYDAAISLELPTSRISTADKNAVALKDIWPMGVAYIQRRLPHGGHLRLTGMCKSMSYRNMIEAISVDTFGWMAQFSALYYPLTRLALYGIINTGVGYESDMGDLSSEPFDLIPTPEQSGHLYPPRAVGINLGAKYNFCHNLYGAIALGDSKFYPKDADGTATYKRGLYGAVNLFYEPTPRLQFGIEYVAGKRQNYNSTEGSAQRIDAVFQFVF